MLIRYFLVNSNRINFISHWIRSCLQEPGGLFFHCYQLDCWRLFCWRAGSIHSIIVYDSYTLNYFVSFNDSGKDYYVSDNEIIWGDFWRDIFSLQIESSKKSVNRFSSFIKDLEIGKENRVSKAVVETFERKGL